MASSSPNHNRAKYILSYELQTRTKQLITLKHIFVDFFYLELVG